MSSEAGRPAASPSFVTPEYIEDFRRAAHQAVDWVADYLRDPRRYPVVSKIKPGDLIDALPAQAPEQGENYEQIFRDFEKLVIPAVTHWNHPDFFAFFATSSCAMKFSVNDPLNSVNNRFPSITACGERLLCAPRRPTSERKSLKMLVSA